MTLVNEYLKKERNKIIRKLEEVEGSEKLLIERFDELKKEKKHLTELLGELEELINGNVSVAAIVDARGAAQQEVLNDIEDLIKQSRSR